jgi:peptidoglycan hydrolase CwlO-like protein
MENNQQQIQQEIESLMAKIKDDNSTKEEKLGALKTINSLLELNTEFIREIKKQLKEQEEEK